MKSVVMAFIFYNEQVLLVKHKKSGLWLPVGGHIEQEESILEALNREIQEEIGFENVLFVFPKSIYKDNEERQIMPLPFYVQVKRLNDTSEIIYEFAGKVKNIDAISLQQNELEEYRWFPIFDIDVNESISFIIKEKVKLAWENIQKEKIR